ncbi:MAG: 3'(2'),5'-bisphosphate nucleotidase CysQ [Halieaceae bacterium]
MHLFMPLAYAGPGGCGGTMGFVEQEHSVKDLASYIPPLLELCYAAGEAICSHYHKPGETAFESKGDSSPVTAADIESHHILSEGLSQLPGNLPVLSEECTPSELRQRREWPRFWMVDPLDGTKEFINGTGEFTINIALVDDHRPVLGLLYVPLTHSAYVGIPGAGATLCKRDEQGLWVQQDICGRALHADKPVTVLASRRHSGPRLHRCLDWLQEQRGEFARDNSGSALKFCQLAAGEGDFYPRFSPCSEWDVAAGQALVEAAGGAVIGMDGLPLRYNCRDTLLSANFLAIADPQADLWRSLPEGVFA